MTELEIRSLELRAEDTDDERREVRGIAVPWDELANIAGVYRERFSRGSLEAHPAGIKLFDRHRELVGTVALKDTKAGAEIVGTVARTRSGDDFLELVRSGAIAHLSIGFDPREQTIEEFDGDELPIVTRTRAVLGEVSGVPFPAYSGASITDVRSATAADDSTRKDTHMGDEITYAAAEDVDELRDELANMGRRMDTFGTDAGTARPVSRFRSAGEFLKALLSGDEEARNELRELDFRDAGTAPATSALAIPDAGGPGWLARPIRHVLERRRVVNLFSRETLPSEGNTIEWPMVDQAATTGAVEKQLTEGTALAYMEVKLKTGTASVGTYGGFSELTRQAIERGNPAYLSAVVQYQAIQYAKATNLAARNAFMAITHGEALTLTGGHAAAKAADWIDVLVDAAAAIEDSSLGMDAEFMLVSRDVFKSIASLSDANDRPIFALPNGGQAVNVAGSANPVTAAFNITGVPGFVDPALPVNTVRIGAGEAMTTLESPGAPFRLEDDDIVNLTRAFSLYGYAAWTENDANAVVSVDVDGI